MVASSFCMTGHQPFSLRHPITACKFCLDNLSASFLVRPMDAEFSQLHMCI